MSPYKIAPLPLRARWLNKDSFLILSNQEAGICPIKEIKSIFFRV
jgi:hypothetical protein